MSEDTFASDEEENQGSEGESGEPTAQRKARSATQVLTELSDDPINQYVKACKYLEAVNGKKARLLKVCSQETLSYLEKHRPELLG
jgi:hypothetical protein